jgi:hypothetical protein
VAKLYFLFADHLGPTNYRSPAKQDTLPGFSMPTGDNHTRMSRLAESAYTSPYSRVGAPTPHPNTDPYVPLRATALSTLEAMGYDPETMVERGVLWAEDQDPFGHMMHAKYMQFLGNCFHRVMESFGGYLSQEEYNAMILGKTVIPVVRKYELNIRKEVKYPDSVSFAPDIQCLPLMKSSSLQPIEKT